MRGCSAASTLGRSIKQRRTPDEPQAQGVRRRDSSWSEAERFVTDALTTIERARGFLEAATLSEDWVRRMGQRALLLEAHHTTHIEGTQLSVEQAEQLWAGRAGGAQAGAAEDRADEAVRKAGKFVIVEDVAIPTNVDRWGLDPVEAQVVSQALTTGAKGVILDDLAGRRCAQSLGLSVIGTIGLIARATKLGIVPQAAPIISAVRYAGLYLSETLVSAVLAELGEA